MRDEAEYELVECRTCGTEFNLGAQYYYDNLCPSCKNEKDGTASWPSCTICHERYEPGTGTTATVTNPSMRGGTETVNVCSDECRKKGQRRPH